jgi:protein-tyrosine phosphatase
MSHVDLHLHLLPGVDDGPPDEAASLEHAERLAREGVHEATVTPHVGHPDFPLDVHTIPARTRSLQTAIDAAGIALRLHPGGEVYPTAATALSRNELEVIAHGPAGARWVLLEVPFAGVDAAYVEACRHVRRLGFAPLIAHPERAAGFLPRGLVRLGAVLADGAVLQVNVCSLLGRHGDEARGAGARLVRDGLAYVLASDGHGRARRHTLAAGTELAVAAGASPLRARQLTKANPRFLLEHGIASTPQRGEGPAWRSPHHRRIALAQTAAHARR